MYCLGQKSPYTKLSNCKCNIPSVKKFPAQSVFPLVLTQNLKVRFYRYLLRNVLARNLLFFVKNNICFGDDQLMFAFICVKESNSIFFRKLRYSLSRWHKSHLNNSQPQQIPFLLTPETSHLKLRLIKLRPSTLLTA